ncbi:MAG: RNA polymerase sigma-54 factor [Planctomycetia bacterium]|nr:RNA polymerase sigma-54 factor [Planctomycetia bacterium]
MSLGQSMRQEQKLSPRMYQSMEVLQMPIMDLNERLNQELEENPVLELAEPTVDEFDPIEPEEPTGDPGAKELVVDAESGETDFDRLDALSRDWDDVFDEEHRRSRNGIDEEGDRKHDAMQNMASRPESLQDYLNDQLSYLDLDDRQSRIVKFIITNIDESGFLSVIDESDPEYLKMLGDRQYEPERAVRRRVPSLEELAGNFCQLDEEVTTDEIEEALFTVQQLDPPGVGARDLRECLLLQVTADTPHRDLVRRMIEDHLGDIPHNRLPAIERATGASIPVIKEAIEVIRRLNPKPGATFAPDNIPYVVPDLEVTRDDNGEYQIKLLDDWLPNVYISPRYIELLKDKDTTPEMKEYLRKKIQSATWLQESIEQRRNTLQKVTRAIIEHQKAFLEKGPEYVQPLKMQQIADQVGVHVTTVSRAVDDKWVQTPRGIMPLKRFFGGGKTVGGEEVAYEVMKQKLLEIIGAEDKSNPLSDEDLVDRMNELGYPVKRRTITKYRQIANIPSSRERKEWAK